MTARASVAAVCLTLLVGCGSDGAAREALAETATKLDTIRSGQLSLRVEMTTDGAPDAPVGFALEGPFRLGEPGELPEADMTSTRLLGGEETSSRFLVTAGTAYVETAGGVLELPDERVEGLRRASGELQGEGGLNSLDLGRWVEDASIEDAGQLDGAPVSRITAGLDAPNALAGLFGLVEDLGAADALGGLDRKSIKQLERSIRSSELEAVTGTEDRLLRHLTVEIRLGADAPDGVAKALQGLLGVRMLFDLELSNHNGDVAIDPPDDSELVPAT